jgi:hypothetical protein
MPVFPATRQLDAIDLRIQSRFVPNADFGRSDVSLYQPSLRLRLTSPLNDRAVVRLVVQGGSRQYDFDGAIGLLAPGFSTRESADEFYATAMSFQGALLLHEGRLLFSAAERWSLLASADGKFAWGVGAFADSGTGSGSVAVACRIPRRVRVAIGVSVGSSLDSSGAQP